MAWVLAWLRKSWVIEIRPCYFVGMVIWTTCHSWRRNKRGGKWPVNQPRDLIRHGLWQRCDDFLSGVT